MRQIFCIIAMAVPTIAHADIITCRFTEPFVTTVYSTTQNTLRVYYKVERRQEVLRNISFQIIQAGRFELWDTNRRPVQRLELTFTGSDGMSDKNYPYDVHWITSDLRGGCTSIHLGAK